MIELEKDLLEEVSRRWLRRGLLMLLSMRRLRLVLLGIVLIVLILLLPALRRRSRMMLLHWRTAKRLRSSARVHRASISIDDEATLDVLWMLLSVQRLLIGNPAGRRLRWARSWRIRTRRGGR